MRDTKPEAQNPDPNPGTRNPKSESRSPNPGTRTLTPKSRIPNAEFRIPNPTTRSPNPETRNMNPETRNTNPDFQNPNPEIRIQTPESRITNHESRNPKPWALNQQPKPPKSSILITGRVRHIVRRVGPEGRAAARDRATHARAGGGARGAYRVGPRPHAQGSHQALQTIVREDEESVPKANVNFVVPFLLDPRELVLQGYLAYQKSPPRRTLR